MRLGFKPREWQRYTPAELWAYRDGWVWRRQQDLSALAAAVEHMPIVLGALMGSKRRRDVPETAQVLRAGVRSDSSRKAVLHALRELEAGLVNDIHAPTQEPQADPDE